MIRTRAGRSVAAMILVLLCSCEPADPPAPMRHVATQSSANLAHTQVVLTLDEPIEQGKNAVWCASIVAAWKVLCDDVAGGPVEVEGDVPQVSALNAAADPRKAIPDGALYAQAGLVQQGIIETVTKEMAASFPGVPAPEFPHIAGNSYLAYSYLQAQVPFTLPYFLNDQPLGFKGTDGDAKVVSFGLRDKDDYAYRDIRDQIQVLFRKGSSHNGNFQFAIDLCVQSEPSQVVVARMDRKASLAEALAWVAEESKAYAADEDNKLYTKVHDSENVLIPQMLWRITHEWTDLQGIGLKNPAFKGSILDVVRQDIGFQLDRNGAGVKSEAAMYTRYAGDDFNVGGPFLVYMTKRGANTPYFVLWVENAELLQRW